MFALVVVFTKVGVNKYRRCGIKIIKKKHEREYENKSFSLEHHELFNRIQCVFYSFFAYQLNKTLLFVVVFLQ